MSLLIHVFHPVLGLSLLPQLATGDLTVEYEQLEALEHETQVLFDHLNIQATIIEARDLKGGLYIG